MEFLSSSVKKSSSFVSELRCVYLDQAEVIFSFFLMLELMKAKRRHRILLTVNLKTLKRALSLSLFDSLMLWVFALCV